jgi:two-component system sensor histidine kinase VicK
MTTAHHYIDVDLAGAPHMALNGDRDHLEQVLDNLINNAIKFSPEGGSIQVSVKEERDALQLSVHDPGVGISPQLLEAIFGLFYQAEDPVSRRTGGMGLGLYISKEIISRHGGRIWAESSPGGGSTFLVVLPKEPVAAPTG